MIAAAIRKDVALLVRDRGSLISLFALPIVFTLTFGSLFRFAQPTGPVAAMTAWLQSPLATISSFQVAVPGNAVLFGFFIALTVAMTFAGERRSGTWRRMLAAPVPRYKLLVGTLVPYFLIGIVQLAFLFAVGVICFGMTIAGSLPALVVIGVASAWCAVALGLLFAALATSERQLGGIGSVVLLVMGMVGGCMVPRLVMPPVMQTLGLAVPHGWALDAYYAVLVRPETSVLDVLPAAGALVAFGVGFATIGLARFRFESP